MQFCRKWPSIDNTTDKGKGPSGGVTEGPTPARVDEKSIPTHAHTGGSTGPYRIFVYCLPCTYARNVVGAEQGRRKPNIPERYPETEEIPQRYPETGQIPQRALIEISLVVFNKSMISQTFFSFLLPLVSHLPTDLSSLSATNTQQTLVFSLNLFKKVF